MGAVHVSVSVERGIPDFWTQRFLTLLRSIPSTKVTLLTPDSPSPLALAEYQFQMVLSIGRTRIQREHFGSIPPPSGVDSFVLESHSVGRVWYGFVGASAEGSLDRGLYYGAYALLEYLGFAFLHPLQPFIPPSLSPPLQDIHQRSQPRWQDRGIHIHTQHPIELVDFLNGWGRLGPYDAEGWNRWFEAWDSVCEWALANRLNQIQWALLGDTEWARFTDGKLRQDRLRRIVERAHAFGLRVGIDAPLFLRQQNSFRLVRSSQDLPGIMFELRKNLRYLMSTGIDYLMTELGTSEFTPADEKLTVQLLNFLAETLDKDYQGRFLSVKVHASAHQKTKTLLDPKNGETFNVNFLPILSDPRVVMMPHSVQYYSLKDPAPTYGQSSFAFLHDFIREQAPSRKLWWFPETAYWVSFDIDVPLFLPLYAWKRLEDLELLSADENKGSLGPKGLGGQVFFSSGWEWGYWLGDVIAARSSYEWNDDLDRKERLQELLKPLLRTLGKSSGEFARLLLETIEHQDRWLVWGGFPQNPTAALSKLNGQAYLQGFETWDDVGQFVNGKPLPQIAHQPLRYLPSELEGSEDEPTRKQLMLLLGGMRRDLGADAKAWEELRDKVRLQKHPQLKLFEEFADGTRINALRAEFVEQIYAYHFHRIETGRALPSDLKRTAGESLAKAAELVAERQLQYRAPIDDIAAWRKNPTVYPFTYLWTVRSLFYWWRDYLKAEQEISDPCYLNIIDPVRTSGLTKSNPLLEDPLDLFSLLLRRVGFENCLRVPESEPKFP